MLTNQPSIHPGLYPQPEQPIGRTLLVPCFQEATRVRGAFGWFSAGWIDKLAPGLAEYLNRPAAKPIEFTVSPMIFEPERLAIENAHQMTADEAASLVADVFISGRPDASTLGKHALDCLSWMIATDMLRLRVAVPVAGSNYHPKVWLFDDGVDQVLIRGSGNATGRGVAEGVEHFDVDVSWLSHSRERVVTGAKMLDDWEHGTSPGIAQVLDMPDALRLNIIETAPSQPPDKAAFEDATDESAVTPRADPIQVLRERFMTDSPPEPRRRLAIPDGLIWQSGDYAHQGDAVSAWEASGPTERGIIAMATGAGKTLTALICATRLQERLGDQPLLIVVSAPSLPLISQWLTEVRKFGIDAVAPSLANSPDAELTAMFRRLSNGGTEVLVLTNDWLCSPSFRTTAASKLAGDCQAAATMFIADEAHTLGAASFLANKPEFLERRLALSATPERQFDPDGTEELFEFFGQPVYEFGLDRAIGFCLTPYSYFVHAGTLDEEELDRFLELTRRIGALAARGSSTSDVAFKALVMQRRRVIETSQAKISLLRSALLRRGPKSIEHALIYASAKDARVQFNAVAELLNELEIRWAPVTGSETSNRGRLAETFSTFAQGGFQVLLAMKVLDEGVDIPSIREAFILASSTVQREWVQRRGRVLRIHPGKSQAYLHDFLSLPPASFLKEERSAALRRLVRGELQRAYSFASHANNAVGETGVLEQLEQIQSAYFGADSDFGTVLSNTSDILVAGDTPRGKL